MRSRFELDVRHEGRTCVLSLVGELDLASAPTLEEAVAAACAKGAEAVVIDLRGVTFIDSTGLRGVLRARELAIAQDCRCSVVRTLPRQVARIFELAGIEHDLLPLVDEPNAGQYAEVERMHSA
jgi:anti-anti-sigma factor